MAVDNSIILLGTGKGLVVFQGENLISVHFEGFNVSMIYHDERTGRLWAGISHKHWGQKLHYSDDMTQSWEEATIPNFADAQLPNGDKARLIQIWSMQHGGKDRPGHLWLGTEPGGLFQSKNNGLSFELVESLWNHPSRLNEEQWFGTGSDHPFIHSIVVDPADSNHVYIAVSCAGVFETTDAGNSWQPRNQGLVAAYLPNPDVEVGHDPHLLLMPQTDHQVLWQQNHCGIFYSSNAAKIWNNVSVKNGVPDYGFALAIDDQNPAAAWVIPATSDALRIAPQLSLQVFKTEDFGKNWVSQSEGLPNKNTFDIVLRKAFVRTNGLMVFGTNNGNVYRLLPGSVKWEVLTSNLARVNTVSVLT